MLVRNGFSALEVSGVAEALAPVADVRRLRVGQTVWLRRDRRGAPSGIEMPLDDFRRVSVVRAGEG